MLAPNKRLLVGGGYLGHQRNPTEDQNFGRQTYPKKALGTTSCLIPGGKYICTGRADFRLISDEDLPSLKFPFFAWRDFPSIFQGLDEQTKD